MPSDQAEPADHDQLVAQLASEIVETVDKTGELEAWVAARVDGSVDKAAMEQASTQAAQQFLDSDPPKIGSWEHLLVTLAVHSSRDRRHHGLGACRSIVRRLCDSLGEEGLAFGEPKLITLASALTVVLAIQDTLAQDIEETVRRLCQRCPDVFQEIAGQCQDIWKRRGQMSGKPGLFLWDTRREEWRLAQEFKSYRPAE